MPSVSGNDGRDHDQKETSDGACQTMLFYFPSHPVQITNGGAHVIRRGDVAIKLGCDSVNICQAANMDIDAL